MLPCLLQGVPRASGGSRPAGKTFPNLSKLSTGHTCPRYTGVSGLQSAFHINHLLEIVKEHKKEKDTAIAETTEGVVTGVALQQQSSHCTEHVDEELKLYCETCNEVICYKCATKWGKHHSHDYESISDAFEKYKEQISTFLEPMGNQLTRIDQALTDLETCSAEIDIRQDLVEANIEGTVRELHIVLEARKL